MTDINERITKLYSYAQPTKPLIPDDVIPVSCKDRCAIEIAWALDEVVVKHNDETMTISGHLLLRTNRDVWDKDVLPWIEQFHIGDPGPPGFDRPEYHESCRRTITRLQEDVKYLVSEEDTHDPQ